MTITITAIVAARNAESTLERAVRSLLAQEGDFDLDVVVVDDASSDRTREVVEAIQSDRVSIVSARQPLGRGAARNLAAQQSQSDYFAIQDADDWSRPDRIQKTLTAHDESTVVVGGQARFVSQRLGAWRLRSYPTNDNEVKEQLSTAVMPVCHTSCLIKASAFRRVGGYDASLRRAQDLDLMIRLATLGRITNVADEIVYYTHPVVLPYSYWRENRLFTSRVAETHGLAERARPLPNVLRYSLAQVRRGAAYAMTRSLVRNEN